MESIVIDNGTSFIKAGIAGEEAPRIVFPTSNGHQENPITNGVITNWDDMEKIWQYTFDDQLQVNSEDYTVVLTEIPLNPSKNKEKMTEIMFETFKVANLYIGNKASLSLNATGRTTGIVMGSGEGISYAIPIYEGNLFTHAAVVSDSLTGADLNEYLGQTVLSNQNPLDLNVNITARDIKQKLCYVAQNFKTDTVNSQSYQLPDGSSIIIGDELIKCPEILFSPNKIHPAYGNEGLVSFVLEAAMKTGMDSEFLSNVVLSGGNTMIRGFSERFEADLSESTACYVNVISPPDRQFLTWNGGSIIASTSSFEDKLCSKDDYEESGVEIVNRKFY